MKEGAGRPTDTGPHLLYVMVDDGYLTCIGAVCPHDPSKAHTTMGVIFSEDIAAHIGPLPDPVTIMRRVGH